ncbi:MAG TPA: hypothetical protein ENN43_05490 [bacterium]|nr:hypothetical protein [bacterium]
MKKPLFATAISCMDGRIQEPIIRFLKKKYGVKYVDIITEPGPIRYLDGEVNCAIMGTMKKRLRISVKVHGSEVIAVSGHHDCAGNPVPKEKQLKQLNCAVKTLRKWGYNCAILKLWVDEKWKVRVVR